MPPPPQQYTSTPTEADTCRKYVVPKLQTAGWEADPHSIAEQRQFTDGRIVVAGTKAIRLKAKKADYLLRYTPEMTLAVVEAKAQHKNPADGLQQAKEYAQILGLNFAFATNGKGIIEFDFLEPAEESIVVSDTFDSQDDGHQDNIDGIPGRPKKYYVDGDDVEITADVVYQHFYEAYIGQGQSVYAGN